MELNARKNEYMFGSELLVCPITGPVNKKTGLAGQKVWLPEGKWTDVFTGISYKGGRTVEMFRDMADIPVLAKEGAIIPLSLNKGNDASNPVNMELWLYSGSNSYTLYEEKDSGEGVQTAFNMVKADGSVIPNLYGAGEIVGGVMGDDSPAGANVGWALTSGRVAADAMAAAIKAGK